MNVSLIECGKKLSRPIWACERIMDLSLNCVFRMVLVTLLFCSGIQKSGNVHRVTIIEILVLFAIRDKTIKIIPHV